MEAPNTMATKQHPGNERTIDQVRRDTEAAEHRARGLTYVRIAEVMGVSRGTAFQMVKRALRDVPVEAVNELRQIEAERLNMLIARLWDIVDEEHPMVSHGKVIPGIVDRGPVLAALGQIRQASESLRKLYGLDAPARQTITVITEDAVDAEMRRLEAELALLDAAERAEAGA